MKNDTPDFGNPWEDGGGSPGDLDETSAFDNPWAEAGTSEDGKPATGPSTSANATDAAASAGSETSTNGDGSSSGGTKILAIGLVIVLIIVGIWAASSISSAKDDVDELQAENSRLRVQADKVPGLESKVKTLESASSDADSVKRQRDDLLAVLGGIDPCSVDGYGTAYPTYWNNGPEMGIGCGYTLDGDQTLVVTVGTDEAEPISKTFTNGDDDGFMVSGAANGRRVFVWAAGSESVAERRANNVLDSLID